MLLRLFLLALSTLIYSSGLGDRPLDREDNQITSQDPLLTEEELVRAWAPLVWLAPKETYFPLGVPDFLHHVTPSLRSPRSWYLITKNSVDELLKNRSSVLYGRSPEEGPVPIYADVRRCGTGHFHVTYWLFFPYSQGKSLCTVDAGPLGPLPIPLLGGTCLGTVREYGSHVGDWEHMTLQFKGKNWPSWLYVSAHDAGAYYKLDIDESVYRFRRQEVRRGALMQRPKFPETVRLNEGHPVMFAAKGSHGLWTAPGKHKYVRLPRLYDDVGYGTRWETWKDVRLISNETWLRYPGKWGNPRTKCHPVLGSLACQHSDGPAGIFTREQHFKCPKS